MELERIHELMDQLAEEIKKAYPKATEAHIRIAEGGYRGLAVYRSKYDKSQPEEVKRRALLDQWRTEYGEEWSKDHSGEQNDYYRWMNMLIEEDEE